MRRRGCFLVLIVSLYSGLFAIQNHPTSLVIDRIQNTPVVYPIRFAYVADSRNSFDPSDPSGDSIFSLIKETINEISPVFVIHGGDFLRWGYAWEYSRFVNVIDSFETNLLTVRGNHELYVDEGSYLYDSIFGQTDYYFDYGGYRFIVLADCQQDPRVEPNHTFHRINYLVSEEQLEWLDSLLTESDSLGYWAFVFAHVPPYLRGHNTTSCLGYQYYYPRPNYTLSHTEEFTNLLRDHNVIAAVFGHRHLYDRWEYQDVLYLISGGGGAPLDERLQPPPFGASVYHFLLFELDSTYSMTVKLYEAGSSSPNPHFTFTYSVGISEREQINLAKTSNVNHTFIVKRGNPLRLVEYNLNGRVALFDITGKKLMDIPKPSTGINTEKLKTGIYFAVYTCQGKTDVYRFILIP